MHLVNCYNVEELNLQKLLVQLKLNLDQYFAFYLNLWWQITFYGSNERKKCFLTLHTNVHLIYSNDLYFINNKCIYWLPLSLYNQTLWLLICYWKYSIGNTWEPYSTVVLKLFVVVVRPPLCRMHCFVPPQ